MRKRKDEYTLELEKLAPSVLYKYSQLREGRGEFQQSNIQSLNSTINCRIDAFAKIKEQAYTSVEALLDAYCSELSKREDDIIFEFIKDAECRKYFEIFITRYYVRKQEELVRSKPKAEMYELWFGDNNNCFGLMITPVYRYSYSEKKYVWENDKSEIRKVKFRYWSVAHILETGFIDKERQELITFANIEELIDFYKKVFYDKSKSKYERKIMLKYFDLLRSDTDYARIAFLIPELRFTKEERHKYRLDFTVLSTDSTKGNIGFELSPDSTHANLWDKAIGKINEYFEKFNIHVKTFMEKDLQDIDACFEIIKSYICLEENRRGSWKRLNKQ